MGNSKFYAGRRWRAPAGALIASCLVASAGALGASGNAPMSGPRAPAWVRHVARFPGGISADARAVVRLDRTPPPARGAAPRASTPSVRGTNRAINADATPKVWQYEPVVAMNPKDPAIAVAVSRDYVDGGFWFGRTDDGGRHWSSRFQSPESLAGFTKCFGADPRLAYSRRDRAFYVTTLCFKVEDGLSELLLWKSADNGHTWTPGNTGAIVASNVRPDGSIDASVFHDAGNVAVDNDASSPHYGRIYVTSTVYHLRVDGSASSCPLELAYSDRVPTQTPFQSTWRTVQISPTHTAYATPVVDDRGGLDLAWAEEGCNINVDRSLRFARSTDGGRTFTRTNQITKPRQFRDNPDPGSTLAGSGLAAGVSPSLVYDPTRRTLDYVYQNDIRAATSGADISFQQSADFGATWSNARTISVTPDGRSARNDQFFSALAVDERGTLEAIWLDSRRDPANHRIDTFQGTSRDGGRTWRNMRISDTSWNPDDLGFFSGFIGDYIGLAASMHVTYPLWPDARNGAAAPFGDSDIFTQVERGR